MTDHPAIETTSTVEPTIGVLSAFGWTEATVRGARTFFQHLAGALPALAALDGAVDAWNMTVVQQAAGALGGAVIAGLVAFCSHLGAVPGTRGYRARRALEEGTP